MGIEPREKRCWQTRGGIAPLGFAAIASFIHASGGSRAG